MIKKLSIFFMFLISIPIMAQHKEHTVANGETLKSIADKYKTSVSNLRTCNPGLDDYIFTGMVLKIPDNSISNDLTDLMLEDDLKDIIYLKNGSELVAKILTIDNTNIIFEQYDTDEPFMIQKSQVSSVKYENGKTISFPQKKTPSKRRTK